MLLSLSVCLLATVSVFAESYPNRPTASEMDEIVERGTECVRGLNERCWATQYQTDPAAYQAEPFTNTAELYLDQSLMGTMATNIKSLVPYYVDPNTVYDGSQNIVTQTVAGLWALLEIGNHIDQFTCMPASGTNAATYGDNPWPIYVANVQERYQVLWAQQQTKVESHYSWMEKYYGFGEGGTAGEAYNAAEAAYTKVADYAGGEDIRQTCKITWYSNMTVQGGGGATNENGQDGNLETHSYGYGEEVTERDDLIVTNVFTNESVIVVSSSNVVQIIVYTTNIIVSASGGLIPDATGGYTEILTSEGYRRWDKDGGGAYITYPVIGGYAELHMGTSWWEKAVNNDPATLVNGTWTPIEISGASGEPYPSFDIDITYGPTAVDYSGTYYQIEEGVWQGMPGYIFFWAGGEPSEDSWVIYTSTSLATNESYLVRGNGNPVQGNYSAVNFIADTVANQVGNGSYLCSGTYVGPYPRASDARDAVYSGPNGYSCSYSRDDGKWYITTESIPPANGWFLTSESDVAGTYESMGNVFGTVHATIGYHIETNSGAGADEYPVYYTHHSGTDVSVTNFYECWLTKIVATNDVFSTTNVRHQVSYWLNPSKPTYGTTNIFHDQGLGLNSNVWNKEGIGDWTYATNSPVLTWTGVDDPPDNTGGPAVPNTSKCGGFCIDSKQAILDWQFNYCTDQY